VLTLVLAALLSKLAFSKRVFRDLAFLQEVVVLQTILTRLAGEWLALRGLRSVVLDGSHG